MEHPHVWSGYFVTSDPSFAAATSRYRIQRVGGVPVMAKWVVAEEVRLQERLLGFCVSIHEVDAPAISEGTYAAVRLARAMRDRRLPPHAGRQVARAVAGLPSIARDLADRRRRKRDGRRASGGGRVYRLDHMAEQIPNPESRVTLSDQRDALGMPRVRLDWRLDPADLRSMVRSQEILDEELRRTGTGRLQIAMDEPIAPPGLKGGWHHMGTTRMDDDPGRGVVDRHGAVHGIANLYVTGSSVFPTVGYANPLLTVGALAIRLADRLRALHDG
jgi:choline dehydrogenase-like flavoprotein